MSDMYRDATDDETDDVATYRRVVLVKPDLYVYQQRGLVEAFYRCDEEKADGAVFALTGDNDD